MNLKIWVSLYVVITLLIAICKVEGKSEDLEWINLFLSFSILNLIAVITILK